MKKYLSQISDFRESFPVVMMLVLLFGLTISETFGYFFLCGAAIVVLYELAVKNIDQANSSFEEEKFDFRMRAINVEIDPKYRDLYERLQAYMEKQEPWRNPDLSMQDVVTSIHTNRTTLARLIFEAEQKNYRSYINEYRIKEFIRVISSGREKGFMETFYDVGFRSKSAALINFRKFTGMTPSEYFAHAEEVA